MLYSVSYSLFTATALMPCANFAQERRRAREKAAHRYAQFCFAKGHTKNSDTFGGERSRFLFQATYQFTLGPQNIDSRPSVLGLIKLVPFGTRNVRRFRAHAKVGQLCQFLSSFTSIRKRALRSGPSVECVNLKTLAGSP